MDPRVVAAIIAAGVSLAVSAAGWWFAWRQADRSRRIERTLARLERQIGDFYGPILGLVKQYRIVKEIREDILTKGREAKKLDDEQSVTVKRFVYENFYEPIHKRITEILDGRLYLVEKGKIPKSFQEYLRTAVQEKIQYSLWTEKKIGTDFLEGRGFPESFAEEVEKALSRLLEQQEEVLRGGEGRKT
jgi:hypothetical protein